MFVLYDVASVSWQHEVRQNHIPFFYTSTLNWHTSLFFRCHIERLHIPKSLECCPAFHPWSSCQSSSSSSPSHSLCKCTILIAVCITKISAYLAVWDPGGIVAKAVNTPTAKHGLDQQCAHLKKDRVYRHSNAVIVLTKLTKHILKKSPKPEARDPLCPVQGNQTLPVQYP